MNNELTINGIIQNAIQIGLKNAVPVMVNGLLWLLTIWIPYLNVGTSIGMVGIIAKMGREEGLSMTEIFNPNYRKYMGEFFIVMSFLIIGVLVGYIFVIIPGIVIATAWSLAIYLVIDKGMDPIAAIKKSNELTYGKKWVIFGGMFIVSMMVYVALLILSSIGNAIDPIVGSILILIGIIIAMPINMGVTAYVYNTLVNQQS